MKSIVTIGGGTGQYTLLSGLKKYPVKLKAVVSMADDGGSTGLLRDELGVLPPGDVPAFRMYEVGVQPPVGAFHVSATVLPVTVLVSPVGAPGAAVHGPDPPPTVKTTSLDAAPSVRSNARARTRTKYVPLGTWGIVSVFALLPVSKLATLLSPLDDPASTR